MSIDVENISDPVFLSVLKFIEKNPESFNPVRVYKAFGLAGPIVEYILAIVKLKKTYKRIAPLRANL